MIPLPTLLSRRTAVRLGGAALATALGTRRTLIAAQEATPIPPLAAKTYVGEADVDKTLVAIVVAEGDGEAREARAYFCDADTIDLWLMGTATGDELFLTDGANIRFTAKLSNEAITGEVVLPDGAPLAFKAVAAEGIAGLYDVVVEPNGTMRGAAATGSRPEGRIEAATGTPVDGSAGGIDGRSDSGSSPQYRGELAASGTPEDPHRRIGGDARGGLANRRARSRIHTLRWGSPAIFGRDLRRPYLRPERLRGGCRGRGKRGRP